jgi:hypothetical protein
MEITQPLGEPDRFATCSEYGLYMKALDWCMRQVHGRHAMPSEWFIPDSVVAGWNERRTANRLAVNGIWEHDEYRHGYRFVHVYRRNDPNRLRQLRKNDRARKGGATDVH